MREVHERLRAALSLSRQALEDGGHLDSLTRETLLYCWGFCTALRGHHRSEDQVLFPRLSGAHPDLVPVISQLIQDHNMIAHLIGELERSLDSGTTTVDKLRHLDGIEAVMETHFRYEERRLLAVLDDVADESLTATDLFGPLA